LPDLPPELFATAATMFQRLGVVIIVPEYIGLNGQSRGQDASTHTGCAGDASDQPSLLIYIGENTDGDLLVFEDDAQRLTDRVAFRPNRVAAMDGSISHAARALSDEKFGMSAIVRGTCRCRRWLSGASLAEGGNAHA
jgi:hypothetical protein